MEDGTFLLPFSWLCCCISTSTSASTKFEVAHTTAEDLKTLTKMKLNADSMLAFHTCSCYEGQRKEVNGRLPFRPLVHTWKYVGCFQNDGHFRWLKRWATEPIIKVLCVRLVTGAHNAKSGWKHDFSSELRGLLHIMAERHVCFVQTTSWALWTGY